MPDNRLSLRLLASALLASSVAFFPALASADSRFLIVPPPGVAESSPAYRYANMTNEEALAELDRRKIPYLKVTSAYGVRAPIRLAGRLHGVDFHSTLPPEKRLTNVNEILDARLALALDDFAVLLVRHDIDEVLHLTMYRPGSPSQSRDHADEEGDHDHAPPAQKPPSSSEPSSSNNGSPEQKMEPAAPGEPLATVTPAAPATIGKNGSPGGPVDKEAGDHAAPSKQKGGGPGAGAVSRKLAQMITGDDAAGRKPSGKGASIAARADQHKVVERPRAAVATAQRRETIVEQIPTVEKPQHAVRPLHTTRHPAALAIDVGALKKRDGTWLTILQQFHGRIGTRTCGEGVRVPDQPEARELRAIVCETADLGIFTYILTPNFNAPHADHFHMEIKPGVRWFLYH